MLRLRSRDVDGLTLNVCGMFVCIGLYACLVVVLLCLACILTPSGRGIAIGRPGVGPISGGGAGC